MKKRPDQLEPWTLWLRDVLSSRGTPARVAYDDKLAGDVLLLSLGAGDRDALVEITIARRPKGAAHLSAVATTLAGVTAARDAMGRKHAEISRLANAKRKFVHRIERMLDRLVSTWDQRAGEPPHGRDEALTRLQASVPAATPMIGLGFHTDIAGADDHHTKEVYPSVFGAAVPVDARWRGLAWDPGRKRWLVRAGTLTALLRAIPTLDLEACGITLIDASMTTPGAGAGVAVAAGAAGAAGLAAMIAAGGADINAEVVSTRKRDSACSWADAIDPCDLLECSFDIADLGNCVPDCDLGGLDCGGLDCSL